MNNQNLNQNNEPFTGNVQPMVQPNMLDQQPSVSAQTNIQNVAQNNDAQIQQGPTQTSANNVQTSELNIASSGSRIGATLLDGLVIGGISILLFILPLIIRLLCHSYTNLQDDSIIMSLLSTIQFIIPMMLIFFGMILYRGIKDPTGATLGRKTTHTTVVKNDGSNISTGLSFARQFVGAIINFTEIGLLVNFIMILADEKHQTLTDKIFNTYVIKK